MNKLLVPALRLVTLMFLSFCVSSSANAQQVEQGDARLQSPATTEERLIIDAVVSEVQGSILKLEGGLSIDISKAAVFQITASHLDRSLIKPGTCIRATATFSVDPSAPLAAEFVRIRLPNEIMFVGVVQAVDLDLNADGDITGGSITMLNRKILIQQGPFVTIPVKRKALKVGKPLLIVASTNGADLVAAMILPGVTMPLIVP